MHMTKERRVESKDFSLSSPNEERAGGEEF